MQASICIQTSPSSLSSLRPTHNPLLGHSLSSRPCLPLKKRASLTTKALLSTSKESVLKDFHERRALKIISGLQNFDKENVASVITAAEQVEIGNYDSFYEKGVIFTPEQILNLTKETKRILPSVTLSVTVPHTLSLPDQVKLAEMLEQEGVDIIQTEGGKCSSPSKSGVLGLVEKATPTLAAAYSISRAVKIPVMCSSGLSAVTAPMAIAAGAAGVGVGSAVNKLNDVIVMIAEVRSISNSLGAPADRRATSEGKVLKM
ncbi:uncharacterized protein ycf23-like isoform X2 [Prunus dulcis]|uniref:uncharacterized protein ycf23-like isoform X2 n=1 Tax=Prunus dulcis TaxID=3755 RepID=UPI001482F577|nr:uncharacterized protein ycf23-like isoform X2 [Prunus dulcis]